MSDRKTLTLRPATHMNPEKLKRVEELGLRFIDRRGRYILQARSVCYKERGEGGISAPEDTWVDIPLVPEVYA